MQDDLLKTFLKYGIPAKIIQENMLKQTPATD